MKETRNNFQDQLVIWVPQFLGCLHISDKKKIGFRKVEAHNFTATCFFFNEHFASKLYLLNNSDGYKGIN